LAQWLERLPSREILLVPGGGPIAEAVRAYDQRHALGEDKAHWLALLALALNAQFLAALLPGGVVVQHWRNCPPHWRAGKVPILEAYTFAVQDEGQPGCLPHSWAITSDSIAARVALICGAPELILLKSVSLPEGIGWAEAGQRNFVDPFFAEVAGGSLRVSAINFRQWQP
jgi:aspartokinase-like uncharacterized kinase